MDRKLSGKVAVVTGASKGIGAAIARHLAAAGASVVVNYSTSREGAEKVVGEITKAGGKAVAVGGSVAKKSEVVKLFADAKKAFGSIDIVVNNAGIYAFAPLSEFTEEQFHNQFNTNVLGLLLVSQEAARHIGPTGGSIINISSVVSTFAPPNSAVYSGTKGAVDTITRVLAKELGPRKIRVNSINPGLVITEGTNSAGFVGDESEFLKTTVAATPLGRVGQPDDIASAAVFLASEDSKWVTGETLALSGGFR